MNLAETIEVMQLQTLAIHARSTIASKFWYGFDFDGTLVKQKKFPDYGKPIEKMVARVKRYLAQGKNVKIFTARAATPEQKKVVSDWTLQHIGQRLEVTNEKDHLCIRIIDNIARRAMADGSIKAAKSKTVCPHCGSKKYVLMPADFETAKCEKCGKTWDHGIVDGVNNPYSAIKAKAYKLHKRIVHQDIPISIENRKGSIRKGIDPNGKSWACKMPADYGYIRGTKGCDGNELDCFVGPNKDAEEVYVIHQHAHGDPDKYDEDKVMLGFNSLKDAIKTYKSAYNDGGYFKGSHTFNVSDFIEKLSKDGKKGIALECKDDSEVNKEYPRSDETVDLGIEQRDVRAGGPGSGRHPENDVTRFYRNILKNSSVVDKSERVKFKHPDGTRFRGFTKSFKGDTVIPVGGDRKIGEADHSFTKEDAGEVVRQLSGKVGFDNVQAIKNHNDDSYMVAWGDKDKLSQLADKFKSGDHEWLGKHFGYKDNLIIKSAADDDSDDGRWVTIEEEHVYIKQGGDITKGPKNLVNKNIHNLPARTSKLDSKQKPKWNGKSAHQDKLDHMHNQLTSKGYIYRYSAKENGKVTHVYTKGDISRPGHRTVVNVHENKNGKHDMLKIKASIFQQTFLAGGPGSGRHPWGRKERVRGIPTKSFVNKVLNKKGQAVDQNKSALGKQNSVRIGLKEQAFAENHVQQLVAKAIGGKVYGRDSEPVDVVLKSKGQLHGIEVKTVMAKLANNARAKEGRLQQIYMGHGAVPLKNAWAQKNSAQLHTVIVDTRGSKSPAKWTIYHAPRVGSLTFGDDTRAGAKSVSGGFKGLRKRLG